MSPRPRSAFTACAGAVVRWSMPFALALTACSAREIVRVTLLSLGAWCLASVILATLLSLVLRRDRRRRESLRLLLRARIMRARSGPASASNAGSEKPRSPRVDPSRRG